MNLQWCNILAADDDGLINILVLVILAVIGLVGHFIKKAQEKQQAEEADRKMAEAKRRRASQAALVGQPLAATKVEPPPLPRQPAAGAKPHPALAHAELAQGVRKEVRKVRQHLSAEQAERGRRLAHVEGLKSGIGVKPSPAEAPVGEKPKIHLNLSSPKAARTAIICAEVLGLPKALRSDPEPWEQ